MSRPFLGSVSVAIEESERRAGSANSNEPTPAGFWSPFPGGANQGVSTSSVRSVVPCASWISTFDPGCVDTTLFFIGQRAFHYSYVHGVMSEIAPILLQRCCNRLSSPPLKGICTHYHSAR